MVSLRFHLQRWAITLSSYDYEVKYQASSKHGNADTFSCSRLDADENWPRDEAHNTVCLLETQQLEGLLIGVTDIQKETVSDPVLSKVNNFTVHGGPNSINVVPDEIKPFYKKQLELPTFNGCLLLGLKVVIPKKFQQLVLNLLHEGHPGMTYTKLLAKLYV